MEDGGRNHQEADTKSAITIKAIFGLLRESINEKDEERLISLGMGDPTAYPCFHPSDMAEKAVADALQSRKFNGYGQTVGLPQTRRAIAEYLSRDIPYKLSPDDVYVTSGCTQAIDVSMAMLTRPGANILLPRPGFPLYELTAYFRNLEVRHIDLLPEKDWEVDLDAVESLADENTVALVIINPGNPCGNVYTYEHLKEVAETAKKLGILVIADETYGHLTFEGYPFVPMGSFGSTVPVLTLGSLSKRWIIPGWRLGWMVTSDPCGTFKQPKVVEHIKKYFDLLGGPATFIQAAVPQILEQTEEDYYAETLNLLNRSSGICYDIIKEMPWLTCSYKPKGSMVMMVRLNISLLDNISDDLDFCYKLAKEEAVIVLPGVAVGLKNWIRLTFAVEPSALEEAFRRIKSFCQRYTKQQLDC